MSQIDNHLSTLPISSRRNWLPKSLCLLLGDRPATLAVLVLLVVAFAATFGAHLLDGAAADINMRMRNAPPQISGGWLYLLGADNLGRSLLARLVVGSRTTLAIAASAVLVSMLVGAVLGLIAGLRSGLVSDLIMRTADVIMSFPSLLTALIVLYLLGPSIQNLVIVLAITRIPIYLRTVRAETMEINQRPFVAASRTMGASDLWLVRKHLVPIVLPTLLTVGSIDFAAVIIAESGLSFLGLGIQPPDFTWGAMVATGRAYLAQAWWITFIPGLAIMITTLSLALLSNWLRLVTDPNQRWRFTGDAK